MALSIGIENFTVVLSICPTSPEISVHGVEVGQMDKTTVKFSIPMDNAISLRTVDDNGWFGEVSASGEIHVQATWRNINSLLKR